ncbi:hypothetical protein AAVH_09968 [Aphelenchoides avenae]|nr:hypothetical protein AAVH_09968 [Aphelenchus avenae]
MIPLAVFPAREAGTKFDVRKKRILRLHRAFPSPYAYASVSPVARTSTVSEVWQYFTKLQENVTQCNVCNAQLCRNEARRNSTSPLWEHLKFKHREIYETTEFYKQRQLKVEALSEDDDDRPRPSSAVRAKSSTPIAASSRPTTSEVWRYFTKLTNDSVRCNTCKSDVSKTSSGRQSTSPLWDHLKSMHPKTFALTDFCRQRHIKVETLSDDEQLSNPVPTDRPRTSAIASKPPSVAAASPPSVSEVWKYFTKLDGDVLLCNTCKKEVCRSALRKSSTSPAWEHLRFKHRAVFETTEFFKQRQAKEEAIKKEGDSDASNLSVAQEVEPTNVRVDADPGQQMHQTISQMTVEVAALLACGTASVPSTGSTGVLGEPPGCHAAADAGLPAPAPLRIHEPGFAIPDLDSRAQAELYDEVIPKETGTDDSYLGVAQEVEPSSGRVSTSLDQRMHQTVTKMALDVAAFLACGTASVTSTTTNDVVGEPLEYHASDSDLPAPAPLRVHEPGFSIKELLLVAPAEISDVPLIVFDSFAGVGAFRPVAQVPNEADEQKISSRTMYSEEQRALLEDAFHRVRFPSWEEKSRLAERLGVTEEANRRNKEKKVHSGGSNIKVEMGDAVSPALENGCSPLLSGRPTTVGGSRKPRTDFSAEQRTVLEEVFRRTKHVEKEELLHLAQQLNVLEKSVRTWFQNRRAKDKRTSANANLSNVTIVVNDDDGGHDNRSTQEARPAMPAATELDKQVASFFDSVKENFMALSKEEKEAAKVKILQALDEEELVAPHASDASEESDDSEDGDDSDVSDASSLPSASLSEGAALPSLSDWFGH